MAQAIFDALAEDKGLPFRAESAGTAALEGRPIDPNAVAALEQAGIHLGPRNTPRSRFVFEPKNKRCQGPGTEEER
jgi:protein-tyrosine-phosphatase